MVSAQRTVFTIGHSTHPIDEFIAMLTASGVDFLVDVRAFPRSRTNPQYNSDTLSASLAEAEISYIHIKALGGRRWHPKGALPSKNTLWKNSSFRNYADYAETAEFHAGLEQLKKLSLDRSCAIMCAEAVWWRCHRRIITDYLLAATIPVVHIMGLNKTEPATLTKGAKTRPDGSILYPPETLELGL